jgi:hypothetical protein
MERDGAGHLRAGDSRASSTGNPEHARFRDSNPEEERRSGEVEVGEQGFLERNT